jgi:hypothetical protein
MAGVFWFAGWMFTISLLTWYVVDYQGNRGLARFWARHGLTSQYTLTLQHLWLNKASGPLAQRRALTLNQQVTVRSWRPQIKPLSTTHFRQHYIAGCLSSAPDCSPEVLF